MADLVSSFERIRRANKHIGALKRGFRTFVNDDPYTVEIERNMDVNPWEFTLYATPTRSPRIGFGSVVGDAVNNLRGALDHLVWNLSDLYSGPPPADPIPWGPWRKTSFPVVLDKTNWSSRSRNALRLVDPRLLTDFEALQPFSRRKRAPHRDEFAVLDELRSIDKHRHPHVVGTFVGLHDLGAVHWPFSGNLPSSRLTSKSSNNALSGHSNVAQSSA